MGIKKFVILVIISVLLIVFWGLLPAFFPEQKEFFDSWVFIVVWIALFLLPFVISFMMFRKFTGGGREMRKILKSGRAAEAVILELNESSSGGVMTINDQPVVNLVLEVHDGAKKPYTVSIDTVVSRLAVPQFQPGARIPVKIDINDPMKVVIDPTGRASDSIYGNIDDEKIVRIKNYGKSGTAKILSVTDTGKSKNFQPVALVSLEVSAPGIEKYQFEKEISLPTFVIKRLVPGATLPVTIDPEDPTGVMLDIK